jgi:hypothetical protein
MVLHQLDYLAAKESIGNQETAEKDSRFVLDGEKAFVVEDLVDRHPRQNADFAGQSFAQAFAVATPDRRPTRNAAIGQQWVLAELHSKSQTIAA